MIRHVWSVFCASSAIDTDTNQVSVFDIIDEIKGEIPELPPPGGKVVLPGRFQFVSVWRREDDEVPGSGTARLRFLSASGEELMNSEFDMDLLEFRIRRVRINIAGLPYTVPGRYAFVVEAQTTTDWRQCALIPVGMRVAGPSVDDPDEAGEDTPGEPAEGL